VESAPSKVQVKVVPRGEMLALRWKSAERAKSLSLKKIMKQVNVTKPLRWYEKDRLKNGINT